MWLQDKKGVKQEGTFLKINLFKLEYEKRGYYWSFDSFCKSTPKIV